MINKSDLKVGAKIKITPKQSNWTTSFAEFLILKNPVFKILEVTKNCEILYLESSRQLYEEHRAFSNDKKIAIYVLGQETLDDISLVDKQKVTLTVGDLV